MACTNGACPCAGTEYFRCLGEYPVLIDFSRSIITPDDLFADGELGAPPPKSSLRTSLNKLFSWGATEASTTRRCIAKLRELLASKNAAQVLVVGGGAIGGGMEALYTDAFFELIAFDVYPSPNVGFVADAHQIPLADASVDAVVVQAVLEHVLEPWNVVDEIHRVLKKDGLVFSDAPFMVPVHEGAYDFMRFSVSGHRWLFRRFACIEAGIVAGLGSGLIWSTRHALRGLFRSGAAGALGALLIQPFARLIDRLAPFEYSIDGPSGTYFLGRKADLAIEPKSMVGFYGGRQNFQIRRFG